ncbi:hypothetical protein [Ferviditalea candida]|uniref:Uncharacterized protein n=1 Tax=Ferviditalea candida TaxID=3108399 RepID=A0ABU5ZEW2_9BACL|nr:hypothetical protein [Paenibacillaceae bacterium T2]
MNVMIVAGIIFMPLAMAVVGVLWRNARTVHHLLAALAAFAVFAVSSVKIVEIISQGTVYMTDIHGIFVNPFFLTGGAYLGGTPFIGSVRRHGQIMWNRTEVKAGHAEIAHRRSDFDRAPCFLHTAPLYAE